MTAAEFSKRFDVRFNLINSNLAYSVNDYEKSIYLTTAQEQILGDYFNPKGNKYGEGFDENPKRQVDFSAVTNTATKTAELGGTPFTDYGLIFQIDDDVLFIINERFNYKNSAAVDFKTAVFPIEYKDLERILSKPYKSPPKRQSWRIIKSGTTAGYINVEIIPKANIDKTKAFSYTVRYIKRPTPIITASISPLTINGLSTTTECTLPPEIHDEILDRALEIAKLDYLGDAQGQIQINQRNE
jgi:hypothetical protein